MYWYVKAAIGTVLAVVLIIVLIVFRHRLPTARDIGEMVSTDTATTAVAVTPDAEPVEAAAPVLSERQLAVREKLVIARRHIDDDKLLAARELLQRLVTDIEADDGRFSPEWLQAAELLSSVNVSFLFTDAPCPEKEDYRIQSGDALSRIARRFDTTVMLINLGSGLSEDETTIYPDQILKIYRAAWNLEVYKSQFLLLLRDGERLVRLYHIGIGRHDRTPAGTFTIDVKEREPDWWYRGQRIPFGEPENVLGTRWLGLEPTGETPTTLQGFGIHGTWERESIGTAASRGCVRMLNEEVEELFRIIPRQVPVAIYE